MAPQRSRVTHRQPPTVDDGDKAPGTEEPEEEEVDEVQEAAATASAERQKMEALAHRMSSGPVPLRVHDVIIKGNIKTKDSLIEALVTGIFPSVSSMQELVQAAGVASARLRELDIFDSVSITLDAGPTELSNTANVVIEVAEVKNPLSGDIGVYSRPGEARSWSLELSLKLKNLFGFADVWDASGVYGWNSGTELSTGVSLPRFKAIPTPISARVSLLTQDWLKYSSYKEQLLGFSIGLLSTKYHDLSYSFNWRTLSDPSNTSSRAIRRQLGHNLLSSLKYSFKYDQRDSSLRPTKGYSFYSTSQIGGLGDATFQRFVRQEFDLRGAIPLGFYNSALNIGVACGILLPWGKGFMSCTSPVTERFHIGGQSSQVCGMGGPLSLLGFKLRGLGPTDLRRQVGTKPSSGDSVSHPGTDALGGDLAVTAFADLSFNLPINVLREAGVHGHAFVCAGNLTKLSENEYRGLSFDKFMASFRSSTGFGIVIPTKIFRIEINYCYILKKLQYDQYKTGIQFNFSTPF